MNQSLLLVLPSRSDQYHSDLYNYYYYSYTSDYSGDSYYYYYYSSYYFVDDTYYYYYYSGNGVDYYCCGSCCYCWVDSGDVVVGKRFDGCLRLFEALLVVVAQQTWAQTP